VVVEVKKGVDWKVGLGSVNGGHAAACTLAEDISVWLDKRIYV
jgi:hypothetical protein